MIPLKTAAELEKMRRACQLSGEALALAGRMVAPGVSTLAIDQAIKAFMLEHNATPTFLGYGGFPGSACISLNDEVIHGIPAKSRVIRAGDIVKIDVGAQIDGFTGDCAATFPAGEITPEAKKLIEITKAALAAGIAAAKAGNRIGDIAHAVQSLVEVAGFSVVRAYTGHGVGRELHEEPEVPNFGVPGHGLRLMPGMTLAIEPMVNAGAWQVREQPDGWTVRTRDGSLSAHFEHTVAITREGAVILTDAHRG